MYTLSKYKEFKNPASWYIYFRDLRKKRDVVVQIMSQHQQHPDRVIAFQNILDSIDKEKREGVANFEQYLEQEKQEQYWEALSTNVASTIDAIRQITNEKP